MQRRSSSCTPLPPAASTVCGCSSGLAAAACIAATGAAQRMVPVQAAAQASKAFTFPSRLPLSRQLPPLPPPLLPPSSQLQPSLAVSPPAGSAPASARQVMGAPWPRSVAISGCCTGEGSRGASPHSRTARSLPPVAAIVTPAGSAQAQVTVLEAGGRQGRWQGGRQQVEKTEHF